MEKIENAPVTNYLKSKMIEETEQEITSVLIVDDLLENLIALEAVLKISNYRIHRAMSGKEAIEKVVEETKDVVVAVKPKKKRYYKPKAKKQ